METLIQDPKELLIERLQKGEEKLSYSSLSCFAESPKHFIEYKLRQKVQTDAMFLGSVVDCLLLTPSLFPERYFVLNDLEKCNEIGGAKPRSTNKYKEWYQLQLSLNKGKELVEYEVFFTAKKYVEAIERNVPANKILSIADTAQKEITWRFDNYTFRGFIDKFKERTLVIDLKTCSDATPSKFQRTIIDFDYYLQAAMYLTGIDEDLPYYIIAADKNGGVSVHLLDKKLIDFGKERYKYLVEKFNTCILLDAWDRSYDFYSSRKDGVFVATKPGWLL